MRLWWVPLLAALASCEPPTYYQQPYYPPTGGGGGGGGVEDHVDPGRVVASSSDFAFSGGRIDFEMRQRGNRVIQVAKNRYMVPIVMEWEVSQLVNLRPRSRDSGVVVLPAAAKPNGEGAEVELATFDIDDPRVKYFRNLDFKARFGDPRARPDPYAYALPYPIKKTFSVLQGFHGAFSHKGSNEFAVDFDCPVATPVLAARPGIVVVSNDAAQGSGTSAEFLDYKRVNFVLVLHDDGTLGEYMHLSPSGVSVVAGQRVQRGQQLALSGNTGFSTTPHLHFQVMTAADDGIAARSFEFALAAGPDRVEEPVQGRSYPAWE